MTSTSLSVRLHESCYKPIDNDWVNGKTTTCFKKHVLARVGYLALTPLSCITAALDTIVFLGALTASILTLGAYKKPFKVLNTYFEGAEHIIKIPFNCLMKAINPKAKATHTVDYLGGQIVNDLYNKLKSNSTPTNFLERHVTPRLSSLRLGTVALVIGIVNTILGIPLAALSLLTAGTREKLNVKALTMLKSGPHMILGSLVFLTVVAINPNAKQHF